MAELTTEQRKALPDSDFAVPGKRKLPIHDREHAELAWKMVDRTEGLTAEEKREARRRILRRLKKFGVDISGYEGAEEYLSSARVMLALEVQDIGLAEYGVTLIKAGQTLHGWRFPAEVLQRSVSRFEGASSFVDHVPFGLPSLEKLVGVICDVAWDGRALSGCLKLWNTPAADWVEAMVDQIVEDREKGLPVPNVGLSADMYCGYHMEVDPSILRQAQDRRSSGQVRVADEIRDVYSVDVVFYPASGGSFDRVLNSVKGGVDMPIENQHESANVAKHEGANRAKEGQEVGTLPASDAPGPSTELRTGPSSELRTGSEERVGNRSPEVPAGAVERSVRQAQDRAEAMLRAQCEMVLEGAMVQSNLPPQVRGMLRAQFADKIFAPQELNAAIELYRSLVGELTQGSVIQGVGEQRPDAGRQLVNGMWTSLDRIQLAFDKLMGLEILEEHSDVPRLSGIRELYLLLTGDRDFYGRFYPERVQLANVTTSSMTSVVKNALNKVLLAAYNVRPRWWAPIVYEEDFPTLNQITWMKTGGIGVLPTVSEGAAYTEVDWSDNEETADFVKKGGYLGLTLEMIDRDDVASFRRVPRELGNAAWRTLSGLVSALFTDNSGTGPAMSDTHNVFDATNHGNLRTTALSAAEWDAVIQAVYQQTEPTSGAVLGIRPQFILVPIELEKTALEIVGQPWATADNKHYLDPRYQSARVVVVPEWTDANDWAAVCDPNDCPGICIGYRYGREPELFVAEDQVVGSMFTNDEMRIKVRFFVAVGVADYRPLHKSNVA